MVSAVPVIVQAAKSKEKLIEMLGSFKGVQVAIVGMGRSNRALCRYLLKEGALITCFDLKAPEELGETYEEFSKHGIIWSLGEGYLDGLPDYKYIFLTPGMKKNKPQILRAKKNGAVISTEIALFLERCRARIGGVTGSAGKTTASTLSGQMLRESLPGTKVYVGGNIGSVLIEKVDEIPEDAIVILELSSFQLQLCSRSPQRSLFLNIRPNHLDIHESFQEYAASKKNIFRFQTRDDWAFLNYDEPGVRAMAHECPGNTGFFSLTPPDAKIPDGRSGPWAWLEGDDLVYDSGDNTGPVQVGRRGDFLVPGNHNISNTLGAVLLSISLGANLEGIKKAVTSFKGVEHRIEYVCETGGVKFYNDSIATSPDRTIALIESMQDPVVLIMGGYDKGLPFDELADKVVEKRCKAVLLGACADKIEESIKKAWMKSASQGSQESPVARAFSLQEAVCLAKSMACPGGSVVLSPACASYDMFSDFEERGRTFKSMVHALEWAESE